MNYDRRNNPLVKFQSSRERNGMSLSTKVFLVAISVIAILYIFLPRTLPAFFLNLVRPVWKEESDQRLGSASIAELRNAYESMQRDSSLNNYLLRENEELKSLLGRSIVSEPLLATVMKKPPYSAYDTFVLDVGSDDGVEAGDKIFALGVVPIGSVREVYRNSSKVRLYSSPGEKFDILIGPSNIEATAVGIGGGTFEVSLPRDTKIKVGDQVSVPSIHSSFVGTVEGVASDPSEPFAKILFRQPVNIYEQRWVIVEKNNVETLDF